MSQPTAILDKSIVQSISELDQPVRDHIWNEIITRFRLVIPWILVEEVWTNFGSPGSKDTGVVRVMVEQLKAFQPYWVDEEPNLIFEELILRKKTPKYLSRPPESIIEALVKMSPNDPKSRDFLAQGKAEKETTIQKRIESQKELENSLNAAGHSTKLTSERDFFLRIIRPRHASIYCDESHRVTLLNRFFGDQLAKRHPHYSRRIRVC